MPEKLIFHNMTSVSKRYLAYCSPEGTCTFPHSYAASFSIKLVLCETNNLFLAENIKFDTKLVSYSERSSKYTWGHVGQFSKFCFRQQLFGFKKFSMKTRLRDISKTTNDTDLTKPILESLYKLLLMTCSLTAVKRPIFLSTAVEFYAT